MKRSLLAWLSIVLLAASVQGTGHGQLRRHDWQDGDNNKQRVLEQGTTSLPKMASGTKIADTLLSGEKKDAIIQVDSVVPILATGIKDFEKGKTEDETKEEIWWGDDTKKEKKKGSRKSSKGAEKKKKGNASKQGTEQGGHSWPNWFGKDDDKGRDKKKKKKKDKKRKKESTGCKWYEWHGCSDTKDDKDDKLDDKDWHDGNSHSWWQDWLGGDDKRDKGKDDHKRKDESDEHSWWDGWFGDNDEKSTKSKEKQSDDNKWYGW